jgi:hypothetical protein
MEEIEVMYKRVWATLDRMSAERAEAEKQAAERKVEYEKQAAERKAEADREYQEIREAIKKNSRLLGNISENNGMIAEEYFFNSFERGQTSFFGEKFDDIKKNRTGLKTDDEFDIVMLNGLAVGIVEVKHKAHKNDLPKILGKVEAFRLNFPDYKNHRIYLGLASMAFYPDLEKACKESGVAIIKQKGENIVINDKHLKAY